MLSHVSHSLRLSEVLPRVGKAALADPVGNLAARDMLEKAIELTPEFAAAYAGLSIRRSRSIRARRRVTPAGLG